MTHQFAERFATGTRDVWTALSAGTDACVTPVLETPVLEMPVLETPVLETPVLDWSEAQTHPQMSALHVFGSPQDGMLPRTAPRFSVTACAAPATVVEPGVDARGAAGNRHGAGRG